MTIIYTSHYMEEVEYLCSRIGIMDRGRMIALGIKDELKKKVINQDRVEITLSAVTPTVLEAIRGVKHVAGITADGTKVTVMSEDGPELLAGILSTIARFKIRVLSVKVDEPDLESVFLNLTGRALRD
jgi:ABC-2 type transport system ATP-binding protein